MSESEGVLREALARIVAVEMEMAYDSSWTDIVIVKPPWTLYDLILILNKLVISATTPPPCPLLLIYLCVF